MSSVSGRHGSYATQFLTKSKYPTHWSREAKRRANCRDAVNRRLVLPLETQNWVRALEVLQSRYGKHGSTPEHYQQVVRLLASNVSPHRRRDTCGVVDALRDKAYSGEITSNVALWVTLIWAYSQLHCATEGLEAAAQVEQRFPLSTATRQHVSELLLPMLAREGRVSDAEYVVQHLVPESKRGERAILSWISEAAGRAGDWQRALRATHRSTSGSVLEVEEQHVGASEGERLSEQALSKPRSRRMNAEELHSLFTPAATSSAAKIEEQENLSKQQLLESDSQQRLAVETPECDSSKESSGLSNLSVHALQEVVNGASRDLRWDLALVCFQELRRRESEGTKSSMPRSGSPNRSPPFVPDRVVHSVLNCLGHVCKWEETLKVFSSLYLTDSANHQSLNLDNASSSRSIPSATPPPTPPQCSLSRDALNLVFASFPCTPKRVHLHRDDMPATKLLPRECSTNQCDAFHVVIGLLDRLLMTREDVELTDWVSATAAPALVQAGEWVRALHILKNAPYFQRVASGAPAPNRSARHEKTAPVAEERLLACLLNQHVNGSPEATLFTIVHFLRVFPPAYVRALPPPPPSSSSLSSSARTADASSRNSQGMPDSQSMADWSEEQLMENMEQRARNATSVRPSRHHYFPKASAAELTQLQEDAMRRDHVALQHRKDDAFSGDMNSAHRDPRPIPKGLHDRANGWNFYGNGGEMAFTNNRRLAHPLSMHPKVMRKLADPFRGWSPKENSVWAHRERVVKWNKKSAV